MVRKTVLEKMKDFQMFFQTMINLYKINKSIYSEVIIFTNLEKLFWLWNIYSGNELLFKTNFSSKKGLFIT